VSLAGVAGYGLSRIGIHQGYAPAQPIAFSHKLHAGDNQIPCLYCHFGARTSRHAGIPPVNVCMNCHSMISTQSVGIEQLKETVQRQQPIVWTKVHNLPDFVYFNHSRHVVASVACADCHGHVETMTTITQTAPLTMGWCIQCHRSRHTGDPHRPAANLDCGKCHY
jgi:formate-dependent nitrite reductase cytochrome c552 subunit